MVRLSVNINKIATLRNSRGGSNPNLLQVAMHCEQFGAQGITVHPRPDERHIRYQDVVDLKKIVTTELNVEGYPDKRYMDLIEHVRPTQATLVPDPPDALTSNTGWDTISQYGFLKEIIQQGTAHLLPYKKEWTAANLCWDYERISRSAIQHFQKQSAAKSSLFSLIEKTPARRILRKFRRIANRSINKDKLMLAARESALKKETYSSYKIPSDSLLFRESVFNRILDNQARAEYDQVIKLLCQLCPDEMSRKITEANIQQAFVFETVRNLSAQFQSPRILSVGAYEDTAFIGLQQLGFTVEGIDPVLNYDLTTYLSKPGVKELGFDIIFSTSVIEHVKEDDQFVKEIASLLKPGGFAVLTCDYNQNYKPGDKIPRVDFRFYTKEDLSQRLPEAMNGCSIYGETNWDCPKPDFWFENINYTFASFVIRKKG